MAKLKPAAPALKVGMQPAMPAKPAVGLMGPGVKAAPVIAVKAPVKPTLAAPKIVAPPKVAPKRAAPGPVRGKGLNATMTHNSFEKLGA